MSRGFCFGASTAPVFGSSNLSGNSKKENQDQPQKPDTSYAPGATSGTILFGSSNSSGVYFGQATTPSLFGTVVGVQKPATSEVTCPSYSFGAPVSFGGSATFRTLVKENQVQPKNPTTFGSPVSKNEKSNNSGSVDKEIETAATSVPSNQEVNTQSTETCQQQSKQENVKPGPTKREEEVLQPIKGTVKTNIQPRENYNQGNAPGGNKTDQNCNVTFGSKSYFNNKDEFIRKEQPSPKKIKQLKLSAQFVQSGMDIVLHNYGCLLIVDDGFVAEVTIEQPGLLDETTCFRQAKEMLFNQMKIVKVLVDNNNSMLAQYREEVLVKVERILKRSPTDRRRGAACIQMMGLVNKFFETEELSSMRFIQEIDKNVYLREELGECIRIAKEIEKTAFRKSQFLMQLGYRQKDDSKFCYPRIQKIVTESITHHKNALMELTPDTLKSQLNQIPRDRFMLVTENDVKRFSDMRSVLKKEIFSKPLQDVEQRWIRQIESTKPKYSSNSQETTNDMFIFVCKSLQELILEISELTGVKAASLLESTSSGWHPMRKIDWKDKDLLAKCLERQYFFMFRLVKHFALTTMDNRKPFQYEIKYLINFGKNPTMWEGIKSVFGRKKKIPETQSIHLDLPDEIYVWYCLVDDVLYHVLPKNCDLSDTEKTLKSYLILIRDANMNQLESLRVTTHNTIRFIVQVVPYMSSASDTSSVDRCILQKQMAITSSEDPSSSTKYRDLVNVFNSYWKFRKDVVSEIVSKMPHPEMTLMKDQLLNIVSAALEKKVDKERVVAFFRAYEEFLINLNEVPFDWFIKSLSKVDMQGIISLEQIEMVDNKLKDTVNASYRVIDPNDFLKFCLSLDGQTEIPRHYVIDTLKMLLVYVESQLKKESWTSGDRLTAEDQLTTTCDLLFALHQTLLFMKEQPEYASFELFYDDNVKPFASLINTSSSLKDFTTRVQLLKQSYWFFRKQNDIDVDKALELYKSLNDSVDTIVLKKLYQRYIEHFEKFMQKSIKKDSYDASFLISLEVKELIPKNKLSTTWDSHFKQNDVPQILAGLSAVWSLLVSKDVSSTGKYLSPHCIQIICIFRLLSSDETKSGIDKHLAQVLTGQGKSLILALIAALLALTGHKVDIGCYSRYLVERDRDDFNTFYHMFDVEHDVTYKTLGEMMEKFINPKVDGQTKGLRYFVESLMYRDMIKVPSALSPVDFTKSVLLIDEVDVFFTEKFYGSTYNPGVFPVIKGVDEIQMFIWKTVTEGQSVIDEVIQSVWKLIRASNFSELKQFIDRNHNYELVSYNCTRKTYNNRSFFDEQLRFMVKSAVSVSQNNSDWRKYKLNSSGILTTIVNGVFCTGEFRTYDLIFNYFRLKQKDFVSVINGHENYGYLLFSCGYLSYAMLPINYPLIVGVSGTLTDLNEYEKHVIEQLYGIKQISVVPTFFGGCNLRFDVNIDFRTQGTDSSWKQYIFRQANQMVVQNRAVLIFFETEIEIDAFKSSYGGQFDRLNVLTEMSDKKEKYINEAGITKTVTLATRGMGRGVDYKSSVMVEKNGGVHVIQTFFSMDIKEETQIKGRTARQDNKGSYEIVLCRENLKESLENLTDILYSDFSRKRRELAFIANKRTTEAIEKNKHLHNATLEYLKSFFEG